MRCPSCGEAEVPPRRWNWECPVCLHHVERTGPLPAPTCPGCRNAGKPALRWQDPDEYRCPSNSCRVLRFVWNPGMEGE